MPGELGYMWGVPVVLDERMPTGHPKRNRKRNRMARNSRRRNRKN